MTRQILLPEGWPRPKGYSNGIATSGGTTIYVAGLIGWNEEEVIVSDKMTDQFRQTLLNIKAVLAEAKAGPEHMVRMTWYITSRQEYLDNLREMGAIYREVMGKNYPTMACVEVSALMESKAKIEIETTAVV